MSTSPQQTPSSPSQIFKRLLENGAIDRFRKSLEKLILPLSKARHQSVSQATDSFLHNLPSSPVPLPDPKLLLQQAQHATMRSVREAVINDVQRIALSTQAQHLRNSLRRAFDQIVHPRRDSPVGEKRVTEPCNSMPSEQNNTINAITAPLFKKLPDAHRPVAPDTQRPQTVQPKPQPSRSIVSTLPPAQRTPLSPALNTSIIAVDAQESTKSPSQPVMMQSIPTDLFQTAHNILQSKEKAQKSGLTAAQELHLNQRPQAHKPESCSKGERANEDVDSTAADAHKNTSKCQGTEQNSEQPTGSSSDCEARRQEQQHLGLAKTTETEQEKPDTLNNSSTEKGEEKFENHNGSSTEGQTRNVTDSTLLGSKQSTKNAEGEPTDEKPTSASGRETQSYSRDLSATDDVGKELDDQSSPVNDSKHEPQSKKERRRRRKAQNELAELDTITKKRRRKSRRGINSGMEAEETPESRTERSVEESTGNTEKKQRKKRGRNAASRKKNVEQIAEKSAPRKRARQTTETPKSSLSPLLEPRNPNRPRGYRVTAPFCVPEDYDEQLKVLHALEKLLERDFAYPFSEPVDPGEEGCSSYMREIPNPMDLGTIVKRLKDGSQELGYFKTVQEVIADIELVWWDCATFNGALDPVVLDMDRCKLELVILFERFGVSCERPRKQRRTPRTRDRYGEHATEKGETEGGVLNNGFTFDARQRSDVSPPDSDLNNGQLLGKEGMIFRYVHEGDERRKVWSSCEIVEYDSSNKSYTIVWKDDGGTTTNATLGPDCMFNIHRFRTD